MAWRRIWVLDREAYAERRAILELDGGVDGLNAAREASQYGYDTRFGVVSTAAANGDWRPADAWHEEIEKRFGQATADGVLSDVKNAVKKKVAGEW